MQASRRRRIASCVGEYQQTTQGPVRHLEPVQLRQPIIRKVAFARDAAVHEFGEGRHASYERRSQTQRQSCVTIAPGGIPQ